MIEKYFNELDQAISFFKNIQSYSLSKKIYNDKQGHIRGIIIFTNSSVLEFAEVKNLDITTKIKYRYHYMDSNGQLIFATIMQNITKI